MFDPVELLIVLGAAIFATSLSEAISYFLLYRRDSYRMNKSSFTFTQPRSRNLTRSWRS